MLEAKRRAKTYNSGDSPVVTHLTTNPPVKCLNIAEQTGCVVFTFLWSYVKDLQLVKIYIFALLLGLAWTEQAQFGQGSLVFNALWPYAKDWGAFYAHQLGVLSGLGSLHRVSCARQWMVRPTSSSDTIAHASTASLLVIAPWSYVADSASQQNYIFNCETANRKLSDH